jgi:hypothetical protein
MEREDYFSLEQVRGQDAYRRAEIFTFAIQRGHRRRPTARCRHDYISINADPRGHLAGSAGHSESMLDQVKTGAEP